MRFRKSSGLTESERVLAELCERSFMQLWTYPNLFKKPGKELVDLMVIFNDEILLFSDKSCAFPQTGNPELDWRRWFKNAIEHSTHQLRQAEQWIKRRPNDIFLDAKCTQRLPLDLPSLQGAKIHRFCVATGAAQRCAEEGLLGLALDVSIVGAEKPFTLGKTRADETAWLHLLDEKSLSILLSELTTTIDFVDYLNAKTNLLNSGNFRGAACEADVLGHYLWNGRSFPDTEGPYVLKPGLWQQVEADQAFLAGRRENRFSELWDTLIEHVTEHFLAGTLEFGNELKVCEYEKIARIMASESRFDRRVLSKSIWQRASSVKANNKKMGPIYELDPNLI